MEFPLPVERLKEFLPHRPPMIWIDQVDEVNERSGTASLLLSSEALYWRGGQVIPTAPIEWVAQAAGYCSAARALAEGKGRKLGKTFLVGIRDGELGDGRAFRSGARVSVRVEVVKELSPLALIRGEVHQEGKLIAQMVLKLFGQE